MRAPYVVHHFGQLAEEQLRARLGWVTAAVATSLAWPTEDLWIKYNEQDIFLRGVGHDGQDGQPCITVPNEAGALGDMTAALSVILRFTTIYSWYKQGYVDVTGHIGGSHPIRYAAGEQPFKVMLARHHESAACKHLPIIENDQIRIALAFWREGQRLYHVHPSYSFLSYFKVLESQLKPKQRTEWIRSNLRNLTERALNRCSELQRVAVDVTDHLYESCRCAVAHASIDGVIVDPDIPEDRKRLAADLEIMEQLATLFIANELGVPTQRSLYITRNRLAPWEDYLSTKTVEALKAGGNPTDLSGIDHRLVAIGHWPDGPIKGYEAMIMKVLQVKNGVVTIAASNSLNTTQLIFHLDFMVGRVHTDLEHGGLNYSNVAPSPSEDDVIAYATYYFNTLGNKVVELKIEGVEPIDCEVVIPTNIFPMTVEEGIAASLKQHRRRLTSNARYY